MTASDRFLPNLASSFSAFLEAEPGRVHLCAHSHHPWPDVSREGQMRAWNAAARLVDEKWEEVLGPVLAACQAHIAKRLNLPDPRSLVFAPNTHDFVCRILSAMPLGRPIRVLTSDAEFHSFARQIARLEEEGLVSVTRIAATPYQTCLERLIDAARLGQDLIWVSEVFFSSGFALTGLQSLAEAAGDAVMVVDGYHAFMARPVDFSPLAHRAFYVAGGYKYAMAGEGCAFLHCPPGWLPRPRDTGWYAAFGSLAAGDGKVGYAQDGWRFMGATFDPSGLYRLEAVMNWLDAEGLTVERIHDHALALGERFVSGLEGTGLDASRLVVPVAESARGNFLTFDLPDAGDWQARLATARIITDRRESRLRFGFGLYQTPAMIDEALDRIRALPR
ncbi:aminotransferase class V-fold PLP-dependent enzyme [Acetobacteraceae bacterium H6797]|nr:aminotransferase class V-fold PLP-dependent enzyme [Acetobacteraceae bacterium H6797]